MSSENNPVSSSSSPIGNSTENTQQDWMDLDQQGVAGETLKAKKWTTQRRLVDDASYQGNIHTGTEATTELNKSDTLSGDALNYQSIANEGKETLDNNGPEELSDESQRGLSPDMDSLNRTDTPSATSAAYEHTTEAESLVTSSGSDTLKFEEHFDEATSHERTATENKSTTRLAQPAATETPPEDLPLENSSQERNTATVSESQQKSEIGEPVDPSTQTPTTAPGSAPEPVPDHEIITESSASAPILTTADAIGIEDTMIAIDISSQLTDTDGSESLAITIGGVPEGAFLSAGTSRGNGEWQLTPDQLENLSLTPPANSDEAFSLTVTATSTESHGGQQNSRSEIIDFFIEAVPDTPELTTVAATGTEDTAITLDISTALTDLDGSETLSAITLSGLPEGSIVSAGTQNIDGSWSVAQDDLEGLQLTPPKDYSDNFEINVSVTATDSNGSSSTSTAVLPVTITTAPDEAVISGSGATLTEDTIQTASGQLTIIDPDADEAHFTAETIEGIYGSLDVAEDGSWTYNLNNDADTVQQLGTGDTATDTLTVTSADGSTHDLVMTITGSNDAISIVSDSNTTPNTIMENAADGTEIHLTGLATDADGDAILYTLVDDQGNEIANGPFSINTESGVVTLQDRSLIDYETESSHTLHIQASSADGTSSTSDFQVQIEDVDIIKTTDLGGDVNGTAVTFTVTGDHYDPKNIQDVGAGSPHYRIRVNGEPLEIDGQNTFSVEANRGHIEDNHVVRDGNDVELVTFRVPQGTDVDSVSIEFINDAYDTSSDRDGDGITTEDRNLVVKELNIGGTVNDDGSIDGGTTLQAEDTEVSQYIASNGADVSGREAMPWQGSMTFYPDGVPPEPPTISSIEANPAMSPFNTEAPGNQEEGAGQNVTVTGIYAPDNGVNLLDDAPELLTLNDYREVGDHGYNYMGGHDFFANNSISTSQIRGGIVTFSDGTTGIIDSASNGITRDQDGDGTIDYEENAYIYYKAYDGIEETNPTTVTGKAEANSTVELFNDGVKIGEAITDENGQWSVTASLTDGEHNLTSQVTNENGVSSQLSENSAVLVGEPDLNAESDSGRSQSDDLTSDQTVTLSGTGASSGETITLYDENDQSVGSGLVDENGNWRVTSDALAEGSHELSATVTDKKGVESTATESIQVTIDTTSPDTPEITSISENEGTVFTTDALGNRTDGAAIGVTVTGLYAPNSNTNLLDDKPELTTANDYREVGDHGYNYMGGHDYFETNGINTSQLRGGVITFSDGTSGIISTASNGVERDSNNDGVIDDNIVDSVADYQENSYIYYEAYDNIIEAQPVSISGSAEADSSVEIFEGETSLGIVQTDMEGNWSLSATNLPPGSHSIVAIATDAAGNQSSPSAAVEHTIHFNEGPVAQDDTAADQNVQLTGNNTSLVADSSIIEDNSSAYTVSLDITPDDQDYGYIISNGGQTRAASGFFVTRGVYGKDASVYQVGVADENQSIIFQGGTVENGEESNLTFTYDGAKLTVYQDGVDITDSGTILNSNGRDLPMQNVTLGAPSNILTSYEFKGEMDNVQIYDTALDPPEIAQIQDGIIPDQGSLLVHYTFEGDTPLTDFSGNGHDLRPHGEIQYTDTDNGHLITNEDSVLTISADTLLANDYDTDGGTLSITAVSEEVVDAEGNMVGTAVQDDNGNILFTPSDALDSLSSGENKAVNFTYTISDGQGGTDTATATITVAGTDNDLTYVSESAGYKNVVGMYETDDQGNPVSGTVIIDDQNGMAGGTHLADLEPGNHEFFIIANGANEVDAESSISFDTSGDKPILLIDGEPASHPVYFTEPGFNPDGKDHFQFESDGEGGTYINIEDLPDLGDADFGDVVLHTNFEMDDRTAVDSTSNSDQTRNSIAENAAAGIEIDTPAQDEVYRNEISDLSLDIPSIDLPGEQREEVATGATHEQTGGKQNSLHQSGVASPAGNDSSNQPTADILADDDIGNALPSESLSSLFDEPVDELDNASPATSGKNIRNQNQYQYQNQGQGNQTTEETTATAEETTSTEKPVAEPVEQTPDSQESPMGISAKGRSSSGIDEARETEETVSSTDDLHIDIDGDTAGDVRQAVDEKDENSSLDRFSATSQNADKGEGNSPLDNFSACSQSEETSEFSSVEEIDTIDDNATDQVDDAGLNDVDAIQEDLSQEAEQIDANGAC